LSRGLNTRQVTGIGTAEETNKRWKFLISKGANALSVVGLRGWALMQMMNRPKEWWVRMKSYAIPFMIMKPFLME